MFAVKKCWFSRSDERNMAVVHVVFCQGLQPDMGRASHKGQQLEKVIADQPVVITGSLAEEAGFTQQCQKCLGIRDKEWIGGM